MGGMGEERRMDGRREERWSFENLSLTESNWSIGGHDAKRARGLYGRTMGGGE